MVLIICYGIVGIFFSIQIFCLYAISLPNQNINQTYKEWPKVSILLAARNEAFTIERCLLAISKLDYPDGKLEVLIGNDSSEDLTSKIAKEFISDKPNFKLFNINHNLGKAAGKANVLAHLAHQATGEFYFITDCDVAVPNGWIKSLLACFTPEVGIASGTTTCQTGNTFANLQSIDWLHFMGYIKAFANVEVSCTSVGNNMALRAKAYWQTGGYENIDFSITEDYKLFKEVTSRNWQWRNLLNTNSLGLASYISSYSELMHQRKRWLIGAQELPLNWKLLLIIYGLFIPALIFIGLNHIWLGFTIWLAKFLIQNIFIISLFQKVNLDNRGALKSFIIYEFYLIFITILTALFYVLPFKSIWKGRTYGSKGIVS